MRIIGGKHKGYRFHPPKNNPARPTTDIAKEGLFNIIMNQFDFEEVSFLDLFGGTGSLSYEFASRGCKDITNVERHYPNVAFIKKTSADLDLGIKALKMDVFKFMKSCDRQFDLIFAGPPYPLKRIPEIPDVLFENDLLVSDGWFILEHNPDHSFEGDERLVRVKNYGTTIFSIFSC